MMSTATQKSPGTRKRRAAHPASAALAVLVLVYLLVFGALSLRRYAAVRADIDLSIYSQVVWNTAFGEPFRTSVLPFTRNYLGNHFSPILAVFVPAYLVWDDPRVLLLAQVCAAALGALALHLFAREQLRAPWAGVLLAAAFLAYPALQYQTLTDFHGVALGTAAVMWAYFALLSRRNLLLFCMLPVMLLVREDLTLIIVMIGIYASVIQRRWRLGAFLFLFGLAASVLVILVLVPGFRDGRIFHYTDYYDYLGDSPIAMLRTLVLEPGVWLPRAVHRPKLEVLAQLMLPVAFLPVLVPSIFLLGASALAYLFLVDFPFHPIFTLGTQYQALLMPFVFYGTALAIARLAVWLGSRWEQERIVLALSGLVLSLCLATSILWGPLTNEAKRAEFHIDERSTAERALLSQIPPDAGVVADDRFASYLSNREGFFILGGLYDYPYPIEYMIYEDTPVGFPAHPPALLGEPAAGAWQVPRWELVGSSGLTELRRRSGAVMAVRLPEAQVYEGGVALRGVTAYGQSWTATPGQGLDVALVWENQGGELPRLVSFLHLIQRQGDATYRWASVDREPYGGLFPTDLWGPGSIVGDVYHLDLPPWLPPGDYELHAGLYRRDIQQRLSLPDGQTTALVGKVQMGPPAKLDEGDTPGVPIALGLPATEGLVLFGQNPIPEQAHAGDSIDITLYWQIGEPEAVASEVVFDLVPAGRSEPATSWQRRLAVHGQDRMTLEPGTVMAGWYPLELPADLLPGSYDLRVRVMEGGRSAEKPYRLVTLQLGLVE